MRAEGGACLKPGAAAGERAGFDEERIHIFSVGVGRGLGQIGCGCGGDDDGCEELAFATWLRDEG